jgi:hypothetical protein
MSLQSLLPWRTTSYSSCRQPLLTPSSCQILELVTIATNTIGSRYWIIIYILEDLFGIVAEFLVLSVVAWTVLQPLLSMNQSTSRTKRVLHGLTVFLLGSIAVLSLVCFALNTTGYVCGIGGRRPDNAIYLTMIIFLIVIESLYLLYSALLAICATYILVREQSKVQYRSSLLLISSSNYWFCRQATLLLLFVVICLTLRHTFELTNLLTNVSPACFFINIFTTMAIYLITAVVAIMQLYRILAEEEWGS